MPKFFIPLDVGRTGHSHVGLVYGPFADYAAVLARLTEGWTNDKEQQFLIFEGQLVQVPANAKEKPEHEKRAPGNQANWTTNSRNLWTCNDCGEAIRGAKVAHSILDRRTMAGGGECQYEDIGYCPNCEKKPDFHGAPIYMDERP